jgi:two-component system, OmpR family, sensor kinase
MRHWPLRLALAIVLLASVAAFIALMFQVSSYAHIPLLLGVIALVVVALLIRGIRRDGWRYPVRLLLSVRMRLTLWYIAVLAAVIVIFAVSIYYTQQTYLYDDLNKQLDTRLQQIAATYNDQTGLLDYTAGAELAVPPQLVPGKTALSNFPGKEIVLLLTPEGAVKQQPTPPLAAATLDELVPIIMARNVPHDISAETTYPAIQVTLGFDLGQGYQVTGQYSVTSMTIMRQQQGKQREVALLAVGIMNGVPAQLANLASELLTFAPLVLLIASVGGFWLAGLTMRPVQTITRTAQQIGERDLSRRLRLRRHDELGELAATFDHMLDRLQAAFTRQREFTADASHELRTPLTIINLETNRLLGNPHLAPEERQSLVAIQQENSAMARLVDDLLLLARADAGQSNVRHEPVELGEVVLDVVERLVPLARQNDLLLTMAPLPEVTVRGDRLYLVRMLTNVVENALKYSAPVGTFVHITLECREQSGQSVQRWAALLVQDDGPGIAAEHLPYLCNRFYRVDSSRTHSRTVPPGLFKELSVDMPAMLGQPEDRNAERPTGSGLGLAIVQWIAQAHDGRVCIRSQVGAGTVCEMLLPLDY